MIAGSLQICRHGFIKVDGRWRPVAGALPMGRARPRAPAWVRPAPLTDAALAERLARPAVPDGHANPTIAPGRAHRIIARWSARVEPLGITRGEMLAHRRDRAGVLARQMLACLITLETTLSLAKIGKLLDRDHTTVLYSLEKIATLLRVRIRSHGAPDWPMPTGPELEDLCFRHLARFVAAVAPPPPESEATS